MFSDVKASSLQQKIKSRLDTSGFEVDPGVVAKPSKKGQDGHDDCDLNQPLSSSFVVPKFKQFQGELQKGMDTLEARQTSLANRHGILKTTLRPQSVDATF